MSHEAQIMRLGAQRWRLGAILTGLMCGAYFGFMSLVAFNREFLALQIVPGLSWGILLGASVIVFAWVLTFFYVRWTNRVFDPAMQTLREAVK